MSFISPLIVSFLAVLENISRIYLVIIMYLRSFATLDGKRCEMDSEPYEVIILTLFSRWAISKERRRPSRPPTRHLRDPMTLDQEDAGLNSSTCLELVRCLVFCFLQYIYFKNILNHRFYITLYIKFYIL